MLLLNCFLPALSSFQPVTIYAAITTVDATQKKILKREFMLIFLAVMVSVDCTTMKNGEANSGS